MKDQFDWELGYLQQEFITDKTWKKKEEGEAAIMSNIPEEIYREIILRLPVESLVFARIGMPWSPPLIGIPAIPREKDDTVSMLVEDLGNFMVNENPKHALQISEKLSNRVRLQLVNLSWLPAANIMLHQPPSPYTHVAEVCSKFATDIHLLWYHFQTSAAKINVIQCNYTLETASSHPMLSSIDALRGVPQIWHPLISTETLQQECSLSAGGKVSGPVDVSFQLATSKDGIAIDPTLDIRGDKQAGFER